MTKQYDLAIIGTGTAAMTAAMRVRAAGWKVAVTDFRPFGGTCALRGCDPKKMLVSGTAALDYARRMRNNGVVGDVHIDWSKLMAFKSAFTDPVPEKMEHRYIEKGVDTYRGRARFIGKTHCRSRGIHLKQSTFCLHREQSRSNLIFRARNILLQTRSSLRLKHYRAGSYW
jgi:glutathione reductase (NADPH)